MCDNADALLRLQQIQSLKFIGFSLKDITGMLEDKPWIDYNDLNQTMNFKREELKSQLEDIQKTIDQLDHMETVIEETQHEDVKVFCFVINAIIWEEKHLEMNDDLKNKIYPYSHKKRIQLDQKYFHLFTQMKQLVSLDTDPSSTQAQAFARELIELSRETISGAPEKGVKKIKEQNLINRFNVLNPFTNEEQIFLEWSMYFYYNNAK